MSRRVTSREAAAPPETVAWRGALLADLSPETLDRVVHHISLFRNGRQTLLTTLRVRVLHDASERALWRRLAFDVSELARNEKIIAALERRPTACAAVRRLSLRRSPFSQSPGAGQRSDLERAIAVLARATALTDLELRSRLRHAITDPAPPPALAARLRDALAGLAPTLRRLVLSPPLAEVIEDLTDGRTASRLRLPRPWLQGIALFDSLEVLDLWEVDLADRPIDDIPAPAFRLRKLVLNKSTFTGEHFRWLVGSTAAAGVLRELEARRPFRAPRSIVGQRLTCSAPADRASGGLHAVVC